ncbi:MAG: GGDEF domain-containing protein [Candidatus Fermentibacteraceae bacterium]|nr:GGDEF domain-containing protein [Candidatus Fermentibacteraceae bacterium]MBN2609278.1 GGDEF domain-containing protein [Candidatus Fermentibacteraceae bacterium]
MKSSVTSEDLRELFLLRRVPEELALEVLSGCPVLELKSGQMLLRAGQSNQKLYIILSGSLSVHLDSPERDSVARLEAGESVGELSVIDDSPATAFVVANSHSRILEVDESAFWELVSSSHDFACNMLQLLAERLRSSDDAITRNIRLRRRFERDALLDALTGLKNRRWIDERLPRIMDRHRRNGLPLSIIMFDVDLFKKYNDTYGHDAGDCVLASVARTTLECLRPTDLSARYGGEEFVVILAGLPLEVAWKVAERLRVTISDADVISNDGGLLPPVTVSMGIAQAGPEDDAASLLKRADSAMYRAKDSGRDRSCMQEAGG